MIDKTVTLTGVSQTLAQLGISVPPNLNGLTLIPSATGAYFHFGGAASASTGLIPAGGLNFQHLNAADAATLQLIGSGITMTIVCVMPGIVQS